MAAPVVSREAQGVREVPTLRLTPGSSLEATGVVELDEVEQEEEEAAAAAARRARSFAQDARVRFLGGRLEQMLGLREEDWSQYLESEDNRRVLGEFLESPSPACLVLRVAAAGRLAVSREVRSPWRGDRPSVMETRAETGQCALLEGGDAGRASAGHALGRFKKTFFKCLLQ